MTEIAEYQKWWEDAEQVQVPHSAPKVPYIKVYGLDTPAVMLYRACMMCLQKYDTLPHTLYLHASLEPELCAEIEHNFRTSYSNHFYLYAGGRTKGSLKAVHVQSSIYLPINLSHAINWNFPRDMVIALLRSMA